MTSIEEAKALNNVAGLVEVFDEKKVMVLKNVFLFNHHLLHTRMIDIFTELLKIEKDNDLNAVIISETGPMDRYGEYFKDSKIIVISLPYHLRETFKAVEETNPNFGVGAAVWINMIYTFCHELHHNVSYAVDWAMAEEDSEAEEDTAHEYGLHMLEEVQRTMDAEAPALGELPWFGPKIMQHMIEKIEEGKKLWSKQQEMFSTGIIFEKGDDKYTSLRKYFEDSSKRGRMWENEGALLELKHNTTKQEEAVVEEPVTEQLSMAIMGHAEQTALAFGKGNKPGMHLVETEAEYAVDPNDVEALDIHEQSGGHGEEGFHIEEMAMEDSKDQSLDEAYAHIEKDIVDPNFHGIPGTSGTPSANIDPEEYRKHIENGGDAGNFEKGLQIPRKSRIVDQILAPKNITEAARAVWMKLYNHMFTNCGFDGKRFNAIQAIYWPVAISQDPITKGLFQKSHSMSEAGASWIVCHNGIKGRTYKDGKLPGYLIQLTVGAQTTKMMLIAQNPEKTSTYAQRARQGEKIAWLINSDTNQYAALIDNGVYHTSVNGQWVPVQ